MSDRKILAAAIRLANQATPMYWSPVMDGLLKHIENRTDICCSAGVPTNNEAGIDVDYKRDKDRAIEGAFGSIPMASA